MLHPCEMKSISIVYQGANSPAQLTHCEGHVLERLWVVILIGEKLSEVYMGPYPSHTKVRYTLGLSEDEYQALWCSEENSRALDFVFPLLQHPQDLEER